MRARTVTSEMKGTSFKKKRNEGTIPSRKIKEMKAQ